MTETRFTLWQSGLPVADLTASGETLAWQYRPDWQLTGWALSPHLPLDAAPGEGAGEHFVRNLLPCSDDTERDWVQALTELGHDLPGALQVTQGEPPVNHARLRLINEASLIRRLDEGADLRLWDGRQRLSLPGDGRKLTVFLGQDGTLYWPDGPYASTHMVHFAPPEQPDRVARQWLAGQLSQALGVLAVSGTLRRFGDHLAWVVPRFDRRLTQLASGSWVVERVAVLNAAQAQNAPLSLQKLMAFGDRCALPIVARSQLLDVAIFRLLLGMSAQTFSARAIHWFNDKGQLHWAPWCGQLAKQAVDVDALTAAQAQLIASLSEGAVVIKADLIARRVAMMAQRCQRALDELAVADQPALFASIESIRRRCVHLGG